MVFQFGRDFFHFGLNSDIQKADPPLFRFSGLFSWDHMKYEYERELDDPFTGEPSLSEMTRVAIEMLSKNENGFFLMVEGAKIDKGHHEGRVSLFIATVLSTCEKKSFTFLTSKG